MKLSISLPARSSLILQSVYHYFQMPDCHPSGAIIPPCYERIELMTGGRGWIPDGDDWREVLPGDLIWNKPGDSTIRRSDFKNPYRCLAMTLTSPKRRGFGLPRFSRWPELGEVRSFTQETVRLFKDETFDRGELLDYMLAQLLFRIRTHHHQSRENDLPLPLRRALDYLEQNYSSPCRINQVARIAEWSAAHLHEMFQARLGSSPHQWLIRRRIKAAREKLESSLQPIKQISMECGFSDTAAFTHCFKAGTGFTPTQYRQRFLRLVTS